MKSALLLVCLLLPFGASAAIYKCTVNGQTVYADRPCAPDAHRVAIAPPPVEQAVHAASPAPIPAPAATEPKAAALAAAAQSNEPACPSPYEMREAIRMNHVKVCMTMAQVQQATDVHDQEHQVQTAVYNGVSYISWYYPHHQEGWPTIIRFQHGKVVGWE